MEKERRARTRVPVHFEAFIMIHADKIPVKTWDLSLRGVQCSADPRFTDGAACRVLFVLSSEIKIQIEGKIVRTNPREAGIYFVSMEEDSFFHLKKLVQYNTEDPDVIEEEISPAR